MRSKVAISLVISFLYALVLSSAPESAVRPSRFAHAIVGKVYRVDEDGGRIPLANNRIFVLKGRVEPSQDLAGATIAEALVTDQDGRFASVQEPGEYTVIVEIGFASKTQVLINGVGRGDGKENWPVVTLADRPVEWEFRVLEDERFPRRTLPLPPLDHTDSAKD